MKNLLFKNPKDIGELTEQIVITELMKMGIKILKPIGDNNRYDIVLIINNIFLKCQIKTANYKKEIIICKTSSTRINKSKNIHYFYKKKEIDLFLFYCYETKQVYVVWPEPKKYEVWLRLTKPKKRNSRMRDANMYILNEQKFLIKKQNIKKDFWT
jgi:hypothetical protein